MNKSLALSGGNSDARNKVILTLFNNINIGERTGAGLPLVLAATKNEGYSTPSFQDFFSPDYTVVTIYLKKNIEKPEITFNKPEVDFKKPEVIKVINSLIIRNDIKLRLLELYKLGNDKIISNSVVSELLSIGHNASDTCIKVLLANNLIEPVKKKGKGKYKFK